MNEKFYVYTLLSLKDNNVYVGFTKDLDNRIKTHNDGKVKSTKNRLPVKLIYWEGCLNQSDATGREKYLKSSWGKRFIKNRLKNYFEGIINEKK